MLAIVNICSLYGVSYLFISYAADYATLMKQDQGR